MPQQLEACTNLVLPRAVRAAAMDTINKYAIQGRNTQMSNQSSIDEVNRKFWDQMCGTVAAKGLGLVDNDAVTLKKYDHWFFGFYPYLEQFIPFRDLAGKDVLEIGLGYGSVSQRIAAAGGNLTGLDIARGPVHWLEHRLKLSGLSGKAIEGSAL